MLIKTSLEHTARVVQAGVSVTYGKGQTLPLSPGVETQLDFDASFVQRSVRLNVERAEALCSRLLNRPLDRPLRFELRPFSADLETAWAEALSLVLTYERMGMTLPAQASASLDEFMVSLLLTKHPHNYSSGLRQHPSAALPRIVREAEYLMRSDSSLTARKVAGRLGVSLRSLEMGSQRARQTTPHQYMRQIRLEAARRDLLSPSEATTVTATTVANGFLHLARFSAYYRAAFSEAPGVTLRRSRQSKGFATGLHL